MTFLRAFQAERVIGRIVASNEPESVEANRLAAKLRGCGESAIPKIIDALDVANKEQTVLFVDVLASLLNQKSFPLYAEGLAHKDRRVVSAVAWALTTPGRYDPNQLLDLLADDRIAPTIIIDLLAHHKKELRLGLLLQHAYNLEGAAKTALMRTIGEIADEDSIPDLIARLTGKDPLLRSYLVNILSRFNKPEVQNALQKLLGDKDKAVREAALDALANMDGPVNIAQLAGLLHDPDISVQGKAVDVLVKVNHPETARHLIPALKDESEYTRRSAVEVLNEIGTAHNIKQLLEAVQDEDWWVRGRAADALAKIGGPRVVDAVLALIKDEDESIRRAAIEILNATKDPRSLDHLIDALNDSDWWVRERAVDAIAEMGNKKAIPALLKMLGKSKDSVQVVLRALSQLGDEKLVEPVLKQLQRPDRTIRIEALNALSRLTGRDQIDAVKKHIVTSSKDAEADIQKAAALALKKIESRAAASTRVSRSVSDTAEALKAAALSETSESKTLLVDEERLEDALEEARKNQTLDITDLNAGDVIEDRYKFVKRIGRGAFGTVLLMEDTAVDEKIILKFLNAQISADEEMMKRFVYELRYSRKITHNNVIRIFDFLNLGGQYAISMEYFPSHALSAELTENKPLDLKLALRYGAEVADGMSAAHKVGIVHRDLKPANLLVDDNHLLKIVDFGVAAAQSSGDTQLTKTGFVIGSPKYMAPEQILGKKIDHQADIYSLGVIMYEMLTGRPPYSSGDHMAVMYQHVQGGAAPPDRVNKDLPPAVSQLVQKAMSLNKDDRFENMIEMRDAIRDLATAHGAA